MSGASLSRNPLAPALRARHADDPERDIGVLTVTLEPGRRYRVSDGEAGIVATFTLR